MNKNIKIALIAPALFMSHSAIAAINSMETVASYCEIKAPKPIGDKCFEILDTYKTSKVDPSVNMPVSSPLETDTVIYAPDFKNGIILRQTANGVVSLAFGAHKDTWEIGKFIPGSVEIEKLSSPAPPTPVENNELPPNTHTNNIQTTDNPTQLTAGWLSTVSVAGIPLVDYFTESNTWFSNDYTHFLTDLFSDNVLYSRHGKLVVDKQSVVHANINIIQPNDSSYSLNNSEAKTMLENTNSSVGTGKNTAACVANIAIDGDTIFEKNIQLDLSKDGEHTSLKTPDISYNRGVYDIAVNIGCVRSHVEDNAFRMLAYKLFHLQNSANAFTYSVNVTDTDNNLVTVAVLDDEKIMALDSLNAGITIRTPKFAIPDGFDIGWKATQHIMPLTDTSWTDKGFANVMWPRDKGTNIDIVETNNYLFSNYNKWTFGTDNNIRNSYVELSGLFMAHKSGLFTFAIVPESKSPDKCYNFLSRTTSDKTFALGKINDNVQRSFISAAVACKVNENKEVVTAETVNPAYFQYNLTENKTYDLSFIIASMDRIGISFGQGEDKIIDGKFRFYVKTPDDNVLRPLRAYEILHSK